MADRQAVLEAVAKHGSIRKAADALGIPKSTVHDTVRRVTAEDTTAQGLGNDPPVAGSEASVDEVVSGDVVTHPITDPRWLAAFHRYASLLLNGVHPDAALETAQRIHEGFDLDEDEDEQVKQMLRDLNPEGVVQFAELKPPPGYVGTVYDAYAFGPGDIDALADMLYDVRRDAYIEAINEQLTQLHQPTISDITDPRVEEQLRSDSRSAAEGIAETHNRDLASKLGRQWLESSVVEREREKSERVGEIGEGAYTRREREAELRDAADEWLDGRSEWKATLWSITEAVAAWNDAISTFASRNDGLAQTAHVEPEDAACDGCAELVGIGEMSAEDAAGLDLPLHPNCGHSVVYSWDAGQLGDAIWAAQDEPVAVEGSGGEGEKAEVA